MRLAFSVPSGPRIGPSEVSTESRWNVTDCLVPSAASSQSPPQDPGLFPASDLIGRLQEEISRWLESPARWTRPPKDDQERTAALNPVRAAVFAALHDLVKDRLAERHRADWQTAYTQSGRGSGLRRAGEIRRIYEESAPPISSAMKPLARAFLAEVVTIVSNSAWRRRAA